VRYAKPLILLLALLWVAGCTSIPLATNKQDNTVASNTRQNDLPPVVMTRFEGALKAIRKKRYRQAEASLSELSKRYPDLSGIHANLGIVYYRTNRYQKAETAFKKAIKLRPDRAETYNHLGILYRSLGRFKEAKRAYLKAITLKPDYGYAYLNVGILYDLYMLDHKKALTQYEKYMELSGTGDKQVSIWITDIRNRLKVRTKPGASVARK
jgi:Flp pilus assembly protein TadD